MTTTVIKIKGTTAPAGLPVISVTQDEYQIVNTPSLIEWFRADVGITGSTNANFRWTGRKNGYQLQPARSGVPTVEVVQNNKPAVLISGVNDLYNAGDNGLWPVGSDYTIAVVARSAALDNGVIVSNMAEDPNYGYLQMSSTGYLFTRHIASEANEARSVVGEDFSGTALFLMLVSYDHTARLLTQIINKTDVFTKPNGVVPITNSQLRVGSGGAIGALVGDYGSLAVGGAVAELLTFNKALHKPEYATQLALVQDYLATRYAISDYVPV